MSDIRIQTASFIATIRFSASARRIWVECSVTNVSEITSGAMYETPFHFCHIIEERVMFHITLEAVPLSLKSANAEIGMEVDLQTRGL